MRFRTSQIAFAICLAIFIELALLLVLLWRGVEEREVGGLDTLEFVEVEVVPMEEVEVEVEVMRSADILRFVRGGVGALELDLPRREPGMYQSDRDALAAGDESLNEEDAPEQPSLEGLDLPGLDIVDQQYKDGELDAIEEELGEDMVGGMVLPPMPELPEEMERRMRDVALKGEPVRPSGSLADLRPLPDSIELPEMPDMEVPRLVEAEVEVVDGGEDLLREPVEKREVVPASDFDESGRQESYLDERMRRSMRGSVTMSGESSFDLEKTPHGTYAQAISQRIGRDWQRACRQNENAMYIRPGYILLGIVVQADGKVVSATVRSEEDVGMRQKVFTREAALGADLPPIPQDVLETLDNGHFEFEINFLFF